MREILIAGGGPAGAAAAIAGRLEGSPVRLHDRSASPRHKVCGEFLSPDVSELLHLLGAWHDFTALGPHRIRRCILHLGRHSKRWNLPHSGWGLSRLRLDRLLVNRAAALGTVTALGEPLDLHRPQPQAGPLIVACGRRRQPPRGDRLFGFKSHFEGPSDDAVELFFDRHGYAGVSGIENGVTNVCGIAPESLLRHHEFDFDAVIARSRPLAERLHPLRRRMPWIVTGPVAFSPPSDRASGEDFYPAGDSLGFVDPFTGTGILNALFTGRLAGIAAARRIAVSEYRKQCAAVLARPFWISSLLRRLSARAELHWLAPCVPGPALFRLTRAPTTGWNVW